VLVCLIGATIAYQGSRIESGRLGVEFPKRPQLNFLHPRRLFLVAREYAIVVGKSVASPGVGPVPKKQVAR